MTTHDPNQRLNTIIENAKTGNRVMARVDLEALLPAVSDQPSAWIWQAWLSDSPTAMIASLERALEIDPDNEIALSGLIWAESLKDWSSIAETEPAAVVENEASFEEFEQPNDETSIEAELICENDPRFEEVRIEEQAESDEPIAAAIIEDAAPEEIALASGNALDEHEAADDALPNDGNGNEFDLEQDTATVPELESPSTDEIPSDEIAAGQLIVAELDSEENEQAETESDESLIVTEECVILESVSEEPPSEDCVIEASQADEEGLAEEPIEAESCADESVPELEDQLLEEVQSLVQEQPSEEPEPESVIEPEADPISESHSDVDPEAVFETTPESNDESSEVLSGDSEERPMVLAVDDSPTVRKLVAMTLERVGYEVVTAADGVAALNLLAERLPVLILSDINMPRITGYKLCKLVKKHHRTNHIPVVMLSGKNGVFDKVRGQMVGCADYITKPFESHDLIDKVRRYALVSANSTDE
ncbi:MAG: response regulator [Planctomycetota bacterium]